MLEGNDIEYTAYGPKIVPIFEDEGKAGKDEDVVVRDSPFSVDGRGSNDGDEGERRSDEDDGVNVEMEMEMEM